jgi:hypothetical protein
VVESDLIRRIRQILADTVARLRFPLDVVLAPSPPSTAPSRVWPIEHDALQAAIRDFRRAVCAQGRSSSISNSCRRASIFCLDIDTMDPDPRQVDPGSGSFVRAAVHEK